MTTTIVRPISDTFVLNLKIQGTTFAYDAIDEASPNDDTDYVWSDDGGSTKQGWGLMGSPGLTTETGITVDLWVRGLSANGDSSPILGVGCAAAAVSQTWNPTSSYADYEAAAVSEPNDGSWSVADANAMIWNVRTMPNDGSNPSSDYVRCTQLWFEVNFTAGGGGPTVKTLAALGVG